MKIITFLLGLSLSLSSFATSPGLQELIHDHQYFLEVEWDQKNADLLSSRQNEFRGKLSEVSSEELEAYLNANVKPQEMKLIRERLSAALKTRQDPMTVLRVLSQENRGASWNAAGTALMVAGGVALTLFVAYTWFIHNQLECDGFYDCHGGE